MAPMGPFCKPRVFTRGYDFTGGVVMGNSRCSAAFCESAGLRIFPAIATQNKKAIAFAFLHQRWLRIGAADEARTRYLHLGKVALYQMSYGRISGAFIPAPSRAILANFGAPAKACKAKFCGKKEKVLHDFRRGASDRNRTNDTGIFSPLLYRLSYRGKGCFGFRQSKRPGSGSNRRPPA